jgi:hypothetical protein
MPEAPVGLAPSLYSAGDRDAVDAAPRHRRNALLRQKLHGKFARRPAARVQTIEFAGLGLPVDEKQVTADPVIHGLGDAKHCIGCDGSVDRRSALGQHVRSGLRSQVMAGGDDAAVRHHH